MEIAGNLDCAAQSRLAATAQHGRLTSAKPPSSVRLRSPPPTFPANGHFLVFAVRPFPSDSARLPTFCRRDPCHAPPRPSTRQHCRVHATAPQNVPCVKRDRKDDERHVDSGQVAREPVGQVDVGDRACSAPSCSATCVSGQRQRLPTKMRLSPVTTAAATAARRSERPASPA